MPGGGGRSRLCPEQVAAGKEHSARAELRVNQQLPFPCTLQGLSPAKEGTSSSEFSCHQKGLLSLSWVLQRKHQQLLHEVPVAGKQFVPSAGSGMCQQWMGAVGAARAGEPAPGSGKGCLVWQALGKALCCGCWGFAGRALQGGWRRRNVG